MHKREATLRVTLRKCLFDFNCTGRFGLLYGKRITTDQGRRQLGLYDITLRRESSPQLVLQRKLRKCAR